MKGGTDIFTILLFSAAVTLDIAAAAFALGSAEIRMPRSSIAAVSAVGAVFFALPAVFGDIINDLLDENTCRTAGKILLLVLGIVMLVKFFLRDIGNNKDYPLCVCIDESDARMADSNRDNELSASEGLVLGTGLSVDSIITGFSAGLSGAGLKNAAFMFMSVFVIAFFSVSVCHTLGKRFARKMRKKISSSLAGGIIMIIMSILI